MKLLPVGIRSLAVSFPSIIRTNDYYRENHPELVAQAEQKTLSRVFSTNKSSTGNEFEQEMLPYLSDPFRGTVARRVFAEGESALTISYQAAQDAIAAAKLTVEDIDLMLVGTIFPDRHGPGNAAFLAEQLGLQGAAWNLESTCSSAVAALQTASAMVQAGQYQHVLVVICTNYSPLTDAKDTLSFLSGDGAGAFVVSKLKPNQGVLGTKILNTACTCNTFYNEITVDDRGNSRIYIRAAKGTGKILSDTAAEFLQKCCRGALENAGVTLEEIDFFAFNTPTAWYIDVCTKALGISRERTINLNDRYANIGPTFPIANLYHAAELGKIKENDLILVYTIGSVSNAGACVMRWGDVALGNPPSNSYQSSVNSDRLAGVR